ncbi:hypothetical protein [Kitasatospora sp. McL0602]|uniref:hypothetical protein n=1 Tax=Kitasatospora sp. McL0602 TaxID=3439530 RepID=UPI003F89987F
MSTTVQYAIGADVHCEDGRYGRLERVVIDPVARRVTHLVVGGRAADRLVPVSMVDEHPAGSGEDGDGGSVHLRGRIDDVQRLDSAEETEFLPGVTDQLGYAPGQAMLFPYYGLGVGRIGLMMSDGGRRMTTHERVPVGEVQIRHGDQVEATDGDIGRVQGLVIDPRDYGVTHVLLQEGHLWGRKTVAIPISETDWRYGVVRVRLSRAQLGDLPPVELDSDG